MENREYTIWKKKKEVYLEMYHTTILIYKMTSKVEEVGQKPTFTHKLQSTFISDDRGLWEISEGYDTAKNQTSIRYWGIKLTLDCFPQSICESETLKGGYFRKF